MHICSIQVNKIKMKIDKDTHYGIIKMKIDKDTHYGIMPYLT